MELFNKVITLASANVSFSNKYIYSFTDLLGSDQAPQTPRNKLDNKLIDLTDNNNVDIVISYIVGNLKHYQQKFSLTLWRMIRDILTRLIDTASTVEKHAKLSIWITLTRHPTTVIQDFMSEADRCTVLQYDNNLLPANVLKFLNCDEVKKAFNNATKPYSDTSYPIPPNILVVDGVLKILGWVCLWDTIAISSDIIKLCNEPYGQMALANLIGHECQHGILRSAMNDFNFHIPEKFGDIVAEAGNMYEIEIWGGIPKWYAPGGDIAIVNDIACEYFDVLAETGRLSQIHKTELFTVTIGWERNPHSVVGGICFREMIYFK